MFVYLILNVKTMGLIKKPTCVIIIIKDWIKAAKSQIHQYLDVMIVQMKKNAKSARKGLN